MTAAVSRFRYLWRTRYPWILGLNMFMFGFVIYYLKKNSTSIVSALDTLMIWIFASYFVLIVVYFYGVRPIELEYHYKRK
ncbi:MAG TPA: hypothetical protein VK158_05930 [Acidobacteriota bacterium]|nr:hypothetical protein [Acidobacteriota bacterium]